MINFHKSRGDPKQHEIINCLDKLIEKLRLEQDKIKSKAGIGSVDLSKPLALAERLKKDIEHDDSKSINWDYVLTCVIWLIDFIEKVHSFFNCKRTSIYLGLYGHWKNYKNYSYHGWYLAG